MLVALLLTVAAAGAPVAPVTNPVTGDFGNTTLLVRPDTLGITTFFDGTNLEVTGEVPAGTEIAVLLAGSEGPVDLAIKGKVWGFLWMNVDEIRFERVPGVYLLASSDPICDLAPYDVRKSRGLGLDVLAATVINEPDSTSEHLFGELIKLKQQERLYGSFPDSVRVVREEGGRLSYAVSLPLPARIPEATYQVTLWGSRDHRVEPLAHTAFVVKEIGVTHEIAALAAKHGTLYGLLALIIALVTGLATGMIFGLGGKGGH